MHLTYIKIAHNHKISTSNNYIYPQTKQLIITSNNLNGRLHPYCAYCNNLQLFYKQNGNVLYEHPSADILHVSAHRKGDNSDFFILIFTLTSCIQIVTV